MCERISSGTIDKDHRERAEVAWTCEERRMLRRMVDILVTGKRRRGRQKTRRKDFFNRDMESVCLKVEDVMDGQIARPKPKTILATPDDGKTLRMGTDMTVS